MAAMMTDYTAGAFCMRSGSGHNNWRNFAIALINPDFEEEKAHACAIA
jgi:hypothetical protein